MRIGRKRTIMMLVAFVVAGWTASASADAVLFRDDFDDYPGTPARWVTQSSDPNPNPNWKITSGSGYLYIGGTAPASGATVVAAGQDAYAGPKSHSGSDYVSYTFDISRISGLYTGPGLYVTAAKMTGFAPANPYFYLKTRRNSGTQATVYLYYNGAVPVIKASTIDITGLNDPDVSMELTLKLNDTNYAVYVDGSDLFSGAHGVNMSTWGDTAYLNVVEWSTYAAPAYSYIEYVEVTSTIPEPATVSLLSLGGLMGLYRWRRRQ